MDLGYHLSDVFGWFETNKVFMFSDTFPDRFRTEKRNEYYLDEDLSDEDDTNATPASPIPSQPSRSPSSNPSPLASKSHAPPQNSMPG